MEKIKTFLKIVVSVGMLTLLVAFVLTFVAPEMSFKALMSISLGILAAIYILYKISAVVFKIGLVVLIVVLVATYLL